MNDNIIIEKGKPRNYQCQCLKCGCRWIMSEVANGVVCRGCGIHALQETIDATFKKRINQSELECCYNCINVELWTPKYPDDGCNHFRCRLDDEEVEPVMICGRYFNNDGALKITTGE